MSKVSLLKKDELPPLSASALPSQQRRAIESLSQGNSIAETAHIVGVSRTTVHNWLSKNAVFQAAYNQWHEEIKQACQARLLTLAEKATAAVEKALDAGDARTALQLLKAIGLAAPRPAGPTDPAEVRKWAEIDAEKRRVRLKQAKWEIKTDEDMADIEF